MRSTLASTEAGVAAGPLVSSPWGTTDRIWHKLASSLLQTPVARLPFPHSALLFAAIKLAELNPFRHFLDNLALDPLSEPEKEPATLGASFCYRPSRTRCRQFDHRSLLGWT